MIFDWDSAKATANLAKHGVAFEAVDAFDFDAASVRIDDRQAYGETREIAVGPIGDRLHVLVFTRRDATVRVISLRKANRREILAYLAETEESDDG